MRDTAEVLSKLDLTMTRSKLLAIVANVKGAEDASAFPEITYLGFPLSISETFQKRNTNKSIAEALNTVEEIQNICIRSNKKQVVYISMGFGNPYNDPYDVSLVLQFVGILQTLGIEIVSLADTIGVSTPENLTYLFENLSKQFPNTEIGAHLHSHPATAVQKVEAAYRAGCRRFDGAIKGFGGCPMAKDELVGNIPTEQLINFLLSNESSLNIDLNAFSESVALADRVFQQH